MSDFGSPSFGQDDPFAPKKPDSSSAETVFNGAQQPDSFGSDIPPVSAPDSFSGDIPAGVAGVAAETPKKKNKTLWIILIVVALLLCCCCIVLVIIGANSYQNFDIEDMLDEFSRFSPFIANII